MKAVVKNRRKDGQYYWVYGEYEALYDKNKQIRDYRTYRWPVAKKIVEDIEVIYKALSEIEKTRGIEAAQQFLEIKLVSDGFSTYTDFIEHIRKSRFQGLFGFLGKLFGRK
jgi:hypothetical protein